MTARQGPRERLRSILSGGDCVPAAPTFDALSARIAEHQGWRLCKLTGSSAKAAALALPDDVPLTNSTDLAGICRRMTTAADVSLIVDADDGGGNAVNVRRTIRDLEAAGAAGIEIEDSAVPPTFAGVTSRHELFVSKEQHAGKLEAAIAARRDPSLVLIARTRSLELLPPDDAFARIEAYAKTGVDMLYLPGHLPRGRADIEAVHELTGLPLALLRIPADVAGDHEFLRANRVVVQTMEQSVYAMAVQAIHDGLAHLLAGRPVAELKERRASRELLRAVTGVDDQAAWEQAYVRE